MRRAVLKQHRPRQWPAHPLLAMCAASARHRYHAALLKHRLRPGVAQIEARVLRAQGFVKMLHREVEIARAILLHHELDPVHCRPPSRSTPAAPVDQPFRSFRLVAVPKPPEMPFADPQQLRRLHATQSPCAIPRNPIQIPRHPYLGSHPDLPAFGTPPKTGQIVCYKTRTCDVLATLAELRS
jgi:hypothetical protein